MGVRWDPLGDAKIIEMLKNEIRKSIEIQNNLKEPRKADLGGFGVARSFKNHQKMTPKQSSEVKKLIFGKVHISSALPMREKLRALEKT